ncbi:hypothetical protein FXF51_25985 [Nonomuraea sp. PA05]|uniref:hypothetical protein n=1 Tax=Nonomuraea sp. PA05 TaxID=2604466 RepID=UPI0011D6200D|nr:hypothetical protein [Nonomuraea sp. PA05]TYB62175.1 hypothetical protein FXF51_25985 [Nonomuraea sp. PA05]
MHSLILVMAVVLATSATPDTAEGTLTLLDDTVGGRLTCTSGQVVWITERTSAGTTTVRIESFIARQVKHHWSTTTIRSQFTTAAWQVTTTGVIDRSVTRAYCAP